MEYNTTAVNSSENMYPTAYLSNSSRTSSFQSIVELIVSLSPHVLIYVYQPLQKEASKTRYYSIFHAKDITRTYRNQSMPSQQTDFAGYHDVSTSGIGAICVLISNSHGNPSADVTSNQTQRILLNFYTLHYGMMYVIETGYN